MIDRLGAALCDVSAVHLRSGVTLHDGREVLVVPSVDYDGLTDSMFQMIRQNAAGSTAVLTRIIEVLTAVLSCEHDTKRREALHRHVDLVLTMRNATSRRPATFAMSSRVTRSSWPG